MPTRRRRSSASRGRNGPFWRGSTGIEGLKQAELADMLDLQPISLTRLLDGLSATV